MQNIYLKVLCQANIPQERRAGSHQKSNIFSKVAADLLLVPRPSYDIIDSLKKKNKQTITKKYTLTK